MSKNKKRKVAPLKPVYLSPENYIRTNARSLAIAECLVSRDWKDSGIASIMIARQHKNGNITAGIYLVDMYCLGVKDANYQFNLSTDEYEDMRDAHPDWEQCDYVLTHNIIYGAIAFAEDYGFTPHKDFAIAQFILEEDDERVELMELDFGLDGKPFYVPGRYDDEATIARITNTLRRTAGEGNFSVAEDEDFDEDDMMDDEFADDMDTDGLVNSFVKGKGANFKSFAKVFKKINKAYDKFLRTPEESEAQKQSSIGKGYKVSDVEVGDEFDSVEEESEFSRLNDLLMNKDDYEQVISETLNAIEKYPGSPEFHNLLHLAYAFNDQFDEADEATVKAYEQYPDYLPAKIRYATLLLETARAEEVWTVFSGKGDLDEIYTERKAFNTADAAAYYACMCRYFIAMGDIDSADLYMNICINKGYLEKFGQLLLDVPMQELCKAKMDKMGEVINQSKS